MDEWIIQTAVERTNSLGFSRREKIDFYKVFALKFEDIPFSKEELRDVRTINCKGRQLFHGGVAGLQVGDLLLPSEETQVATYGDVRRPHVFMTGFEPQAAHHAAGRRAWSGRATWVYEVSPVGECTVSNNAYRLGRLALCDGSFSASDVVTMECYEYTAPRAVVTQIRDTHPVSILRPNDPG